MARKKKSKAQPFLFKFILIGLVVVGIGYAAGRGGIYLLQKSDYFRIQSVVIDPSLQFINKRDLKSLMGKNIFTVDLKATQRKLSYKYPQASQLKVMKRFPNRIGVVAKQRLPFAQVQMKNRTVILDQEGVVLSAQEERDKDIPVVIGTKSNDQKLVWGLPLRGSDIQMALKIAKLFEANSSLSSYAILEINVENFSKIYFTLSNHLQIIVDRDKIAQKIRVLGFVLSQGKPLPDSHSKFTSASLIKNSSQPNPCGSTTLNPSCKIILVLGAVKSTLKWKKSS